MSILQIIILVSLAALIGLLRKGRAAALLAASVLTVYWLASPYDNLSVMYWLPTMTLAMVAASWALTADPKKQSFRRNLPAFAILFGASLLVALNRYFKFEEFFATVTPRPYYVVAAWGLVLAGLIAINLIVRRSRLQTFLLIAAALAVLGMLALVKSPMLFGELYDEIVSLRGMDPKNVPVAILWLGFSYIAFRLLHTFIDRRVGRLPDVSLAEYATYVFFFPAFIAGPIDRIERFVRGLRDPQKICSQDWLDAGQRLFTGLFKKFVLADALALLPLNAFAPNLHSAGWAWLVLYAYALRLFFDFSGYTDIAIGMGRLVGIRLPENFAAPYIKPNLTQFWNSWHMSLTQWFRIYVFNPMVRAFRSARQPLPAFLVIAIAQTSTMVLIGLWHGVTWNFVLWGLWHAVGLFIHNRWSEWTRPCMTTWAVTPLRRAILKGSGILITFHYVAMGWVFFALTTPAQSWEYFLHLFGLA